MFAKMSGNFTISNLNEMRNQKKAREVFLNILDTN